MNILFVGRHHGKARVFSPGRNALFAAGASLALLMAGAGWGGYQLAIHSGAAGGTEKSHMVERWQQRLNDARSELARIEAKAENEISVLTRRVGELQARALRVDALGQNLMASAELSGEEFDFESRPAMGGPESEGAGENQTTGALERQISALEKRLSSREKQLTLLDRLIANRELKSQREVDGRPVTWGWTSSPYGYRTDPFSGRRAWHTGVDIAGREGGDVISVGAGIVTKARKKGGYGYIVEIDHGDGYQTRYAHAKKLLVEKGDVVEKGQKIAAMGSTGRSTGPHVHFEVVKDGTRKNPTDFM
ncbi:peptidoglycan DD-metalloendopeptidase family protein [Salicola sp. Rm-C-2C1-2]|uniref:M23 family metallopeptidase n=1 Tax=Salicola sp. Rm-C-2C1-2 TaxID=3141321 RepID=UPI0032E39D83